MWADWQAFITGQAIEQFVGVALFIFASFNITAQCPNAQWDHRRMDGATCNQLHTAAYLTQGGMEGGGKTYKISFVFHGNGLLKTTDIQTDRHTDR